MTKTHRAGTEDSLRLLVLIPALNEEATIAGVVRSVPDSIAGVGSLEVVVIDDGSTDQTARLAEAAGATVLSRQRTGGVGAAFHTGLLYAIEHGAGIVVTLDADGQFDPTDIPTLIAPVVAGDYDFATASRFKDPALVPEMPRLRLWGNRAMSRLISSLAGMRLYDVSCGMRCYNREAILRLHLLARYTYTQEVILNLSFKDFRLVEVPLRIRGERQFGKSRVAPSLWWYTAKTLRIILRAYRDHRPLQFFFGIASFFLLAAVGLGVFLGIHYLQSGSFTPHKWAGIAAGLCAAVALITGHMGVVGDMLNRHRVYLEEILYRQRKSFEAAHPPGAPESARSGPT